MVKGKLVLFQARQTRDRSETGKPEQGQVKGHVVRQENTGKSCMHNGKEDKEESGCEPIKHNKWKHYWHCGKHVAVSVV